MRTKRPLEDCLCGRTADEHQYNGRLGALMGTRDGKCEGYEPYTPVRDFDQETPEIIDEEDES